jgi:hypothetical protein
MEFTVVLDSQPSSGVVIGITSSDVSEGTVSTPALTFVAGNWDTAQTVVVTGVEDLQVDGDIAYTIETGAAVSSDLKFHNVIVADVALTNTDRKSIGLLIVVHGFVSVFMDDSQNMAKCMFACFKHTSLFCCCFVFSRFSHRDCDSYQWADHDRSWRHSDVQCSAGFTAV